MAIHRNSPMAAVATSLFVVAFLLLDLHSTEAQIGVCYGMLGDNLPCAQDAVNLYNSNSIGAMRLYTPNQDTLQSLQGTNIKLMLGVPNEDIVSIACDQTTADEWVDTNVVPYADSINYIAVGNEIKPSDEQASSMVPAMQNIQNALYSNDLDTQIKVSTAIDTSLTQNSYPPTNTTFKDLSYITPIINFLTTYDSPLLVNIQPYFAYTNDMKNIHLDYALFTACGTVFTDPNNGKSYQNLFDALYDSVYIAVQKVVTPRTTSLVNEFHDEKAGNQNHPVAVSESGWPSKSGFHNMNGNNNRKMTSDRDIDQTKENANGCGLTPKGGEAATIENAKTYYTNLINHVKEGSPMTQGQPIETYLFAMFDEDKKPAVNEYIGSAIEQCIEAEGKFMFAPYNEDFHWVLLVISPSNHTVYVFDSARPEQNEIRNMLIRSPLSSMMKQIYASNGLRKAIVPTWKAMKCTQQDNGKDCALYVMRFMLDIVSSCMYANDLEMVFNTPSEASFTVAELIVVRDKNETFLTDYCL